MALHTWLIYLTAVFGLSLTPGPNGLLALTHGALYGHRRALWTIGGGMLGFVVSIVCAIVLLFIYEALRKKKACASRFAHRRPARCGVSSFCGRHPWQPPFGPTPCVVKKRSWRFFRCPA